MGFLSSGVILRIIIGLFIVEFIDEYVGWRLLFAIILFLTVCAEFLFMIEITGPSMAPTIQDQTHLLWLHLTGPVSGREWIDKQRLIRRNQVVVVHDHRKFDGEEKSFMIKRITGLPGDMKYDRWGHRRNIPNGYVWVTGDNSENSFDSTSFGPVSVRKIESMMLLMIGHKPNTALLDYIEDLPFFHLLWDKETQTLWPHGTQPLSLALKKSIRNRFHHNLEVIRDLNS